MNQPRACVGKWLLALGVVSCLNTPLAVHAAYFPIDVPAQFVPGPKPLTLPNYIKLRPYNDAFQAPNLWRIEATKLWRSLPVLSPDGSQYFFTEVLFLPGTRQVTSTLYSVSLPALPVPANESEGARSGEQPPRGAAGKVPTRAADPRLYVSWFDVNQASRTRQVMWRAGDERPEMFAFQVLVPVDWSADGRKILVKRQQGVLYTGLKTSDLVVADSQGNKLTLYGELARAVNYYWQQRGAQADIFRMAWDLQPLGWAPGSNEVFYFKAWAFSRANKPVFLGLWTFDLTTHHPKCLSDNPEVQASVAANGYEVTIPSPLELERLLHPTAVTTLRKRFALPKLNRSSGQASGTSGQSDNSGQYGNSGQSSGSNGSQPSGSSSESSGSGQSSDSSQSSGSGQSSGNSSQSSGGSSQSSGGSSQSSGGSSQSSGGSSQSSGSSSQSSGSSSQSGDTGSSSSTR